MFSDTMNKYRLDLFLLKFSDLTVLPITFIGSLFLVSLLRGQPLTWSQFLSTQFGIVPLSALSVFVIVYHLAALSLYLYNPRRLDAGKGEWQDVAKATFLSAMVLFLPTLGLQHGYSMLQFTLLFPILACVGICASRSCIRTVLKELCKHDRNLRNLLMVGCNNRTASLAAHLLERPQLGYRITGFIDNVPWVEGHKGLSMKYLGTFEAFDEVLATMQVDEVVVTLPIRSFYEQIDQIIATCETQGITVHLLSHFFPLQTVRARATEFGDMPLLTFRTGALWGGHVWLKRLFDIVASALLLLLLSPLFLLTAALLKLSSPGGPVLFIQTRIGYNRRPFKMLKFRTMVPDAEAKLEALEQLNEAHGPVFKMKEDPRITPLGRFLRKTSIDELPQLWNVLKGEMSLVGPRPLPLRDVAQFDAKWLQRRFSVKPGLTCLWQVNGRSHDNFHTWVQQDLAYIDQWSFALDLKILLKTIPAVLRGGGM